MHEFEPPTFLVAPFEHRAELRIVLPPVAGVSNRERAN